MSKAAEVYDAYADALRRAELKDLPPFDEAPDQARPWFAIANNLDAILAPPEVAEPSDYELRVPIERQPLSEFTGVTDGLPGPADEYRMEVLPTSLKIRPLIADDLCRREFVQGPEAHDLAVRAHVHEVGLEYLEWRIDPGDADAAYYLANSATGVAAWQAVVDVYEGAGGERIEGDLDAWQTATLALVSDEDGQATLVRCRTPGLGTVRVGPLRLGHIKLYEREAIEKDEWHGRLVALAKATGLPEGQLRKARIEDVLRLWMTLMIQKKKADARALIFFGAAVSSPSTTGDGATSSPTPSSG